MKQNMRLLAIIAAMALGGCTLLHDKSKEVEGRVYDSLADAASNYCKWASGISFLDQERLEARREVRQRGKHGPDGPTYTIVSLDEKTAHGRGPVIRVYCHEDDVPPTVWADFVRVRP